MKCARLLTEIVLAHKNSATTHHACTRDACPHMSAEFQPSFRRTADFEQISLMILELVVDIPVDCWLSKHVRYAGPYIGFLDNIIIPDSRSASLELLLGPLPTFIRLKTWLDPKSLSLTLQANSDPRFLSGDL